MAIQVLGTTVIDDSRNIANVGILTVGSGSSSIITNSNTGIVNVGSGITIDAKNGNINISGILTVASFSVPVLISSFEPAIGATSVGIRSNFILNFNQTVGLGTTGFFLIRSGLNTTSGTVVVRVGVGSTAHLNFKNGGRQLIIDPPGELDPGTFFHAVMSSGFVVSNNNNYSGINTVGTAQTYFFQTKPLAPGDVFGGGNVICLASPIRWVVAPASAEVSRRWLERVESNTVAQACSGCGGWFIPTCTQLVNPGFVCRSFWENLSSGCSYWSESQAPGVDPTYKHFVRMDPGGPCGAYGCCFTNMCGVLCIRSFRCVTY